MISTLIHIFHFPQFLQPSPHGYELQNTTAAERCPYLLSHVTACQKNLGGETKKARLQNSSFFFFFDCQYFFFYVVLIVATQLLQYRSETDSNLGNYLFLISGSIHLAFQNFRTETAYQASKDCSHPPGGTSSMCENPELHMSQVSLETELTRQ